MMNKLWLILLLILALPTLTLAAERVEINTATLQQLEEIIGVGPVIAQHIIGARPYTSVDDLLRVKGIGEKTLQKIKDQGLAYVTGEVPIKVPTPPPPAPVVLTYPTGIIINKLLPSPKGADEADEWIELKNTTGADINLSGWKLQDMQGTTTTYILPTNSIIFGNNYLVLKRPTTNILLNNDQDGLQLLFPDGTIADSVSYSNAKTGQTYSKTATGWQWTGGTAKIIALPKAKKNDNKVGVASTISQPTKNPFTAELQGSNPLNPWLLFFIALGLTLVAGVVTLILKLTLLKKDVRT